MLKLVHGTSMGWVKQKVIYKSTSFHVCLCTFSVKPILVVHSDDYVWQMCSREITLKILFSCVFNTSVLANGNGVLLLPVACHHCLRPDRLQITLVLLCWLTIEQLFFFCLSSACFLDCPWPMTCSHNVCLMLEVLSGGLIGLSNLDLREHDW